MNFGHHKGARRLKDGVGKTTRTQVIGCLPRSPTTTCNLPATTWLGTGERKSGGIRIICRCAIFLCLCQVQRYNRTVVTPLPSPNDYHLPLLVKEKNSSTSVHSRKSRLHRSSPINYSHICVPCLDMRLNSSIFYALMCSTAILHTSRGSPLPHLGSDRGTPPSPAPDRGRSPGTQPSLASDRGSPTPSIDTSGEDSGPKASFYLQMLPGRRSLQPASGLITPELIHNFIKAGFIPGIAFRYLWEIGLRKQEIHPDSVHFDVDQALDISIPILYPRHGMNMARYL
ncbi:hypothetical protein EV361DRAFT_421414 [Lentinula raphanica]|nr:hypothetical protein EV361DRAFT_421414 [Lentinula raphanica]